MTAGATYPPANTPRVALAQLPGNDALDEVDKLPKDIEFHVDEIVMYSIVLIYPGPVYPPAINPLVDDEQPHRCLV